MISMTGYGRAACQVFGRHLVVEKRSLNHRYFDLKLRLPWADAALEALVTQAVKRRIERGALTVTVREDAGIGAPEMRVNVPLAKRYYQALVELARELALPTEIPIEVLVSLRDVIAIGESERSGDELFEALRPGIEAALDALIVMRRREGEVLAEAVRAHTAELSQRIACIGELSRDAPEQYRKRLEERIARALAAGQIDPQRLAQEVAIFADRADISEELVRLSSHLAQLGVLCQENGPVGRKLDFLLQELNREINTVGSKAQSAEIVSHVVEVKATLEKLREQVQNVE